MKISFGILINKIKWKNNKEGRKYIKKQQVQLKTILRRKNKNMEEKTGKIKR